MAEERNYEGGERRVNDGERGGRREGWYLRWLNIEATAHGSPTSPSDIKWSRVYPK
jgi:hypothetical protein